MYLLSFPFAAFLPLAFAMRVAGAADIIGGRA